MPFIVSIAPSIRRIMGDVIAKYHASVAQGNQPVVSEQKNEVKYLGAK
jgi:hypothetical protein